MSGAIDDRPSLFFVTERMGSLFVYFNTPRVIQRTLRLPLTGGEGCVNVVIGPDRRPSAIQILNAWHVGSGPRELDIYDYQLKWELYERAVALVQFARCDVRDVQDILDDTVQVAQAWVQGRLIHSTLELVP